MDQDESIKMEDEVESKDGSEVLPFEFVALEACLEATCSRLDSEVNVLSSSSIVFFFNYYGPSVINVI